MNSQAFELLSKRAILEKIKGFILFCDQIIIKTIKIKTKIEKNPKFVLNLMKNYLNEFPSLDGSDTKSTATNITSLINPQNLKLIIFFR